MAKHIYAAIYAIYRPVKIFGFTFFVLDGTVVGHIECEGVMAPKTLAGLTDSQRVTQRKTILTSVALLGVQEVSVNLN